MTSDDFLEAQGILIDFNPAMFNLVQAYTHLRAIHGLQATTYYKTSQWDLWYHTHEAEKYLHMAEIFIEQEKQND